MDAPGPDLDGLFSRIPRVDAVKRPRRFWGLTGWGPANWATLAAASVVLFFLYGGPGSWLTGWTAFVLVAALIGGFVAATYVPRPGVRLEWSPCALVPLALVVLMPFVADPLQPLTGAIGLALLIALASQRAAGAGCGIR